jgi:hypothetical protein
LKTLVFYSKKQVFFYRAWTLSGSGSSLKNKRFTRQNACFWLFLNHVCPLPGLSNVCRFDGSHIKQKYGFIAFF